MKSRLLPTSLAALSLLALTLTLCPGAVAAVPTQSESFSGTYTTALDPGKVTGAGGFAETNLYLVFGGTLSGTFTASAQLLATAVPVGSTQFTRTFDVPVGITGLRVGVLSLYATPTANFGVAVALATATATTFLTLDFSTAFPGGTFTEGGIGTALANGDTTTLTNFFKTFNTDFIPVTQDGTVTGGSIVDFTAGSNGGGLSLAVTPVPEPGTVSLALLGGLALAAGTAVRRRRAAGTPPRVGA